MFTPWIAIKIPIKNMNVFTNPLALVTLTFIRNVPSNRIKKPMILLNIPHDPSMALSFIKRIRYKANIN